MLLEAFDRHADHVREVVPRERLLEFEPSQGWGPLCEFLEVEVPGVGFPHLNEPQSLVQIRKDMYWERWRVVVRKGWGRWGVMGVALVVAVWLASGASIFRS